MAALIRQVAAVEFAEGMRCQPFRHGCPVFSSGALHSRCQAILTTNVAELLEIMSARCGRRVDDECRKVSGRKFYTFVAYVREKHDVVRTSTYEYR